MAQHLPIADIKFIAEFAAFCRTKGDGAYAYTSNCGCACAQFLLASGRAKTPHVIPGAWGERSGDWPNEMPEGVQDALNPRGCSADFRFDLLADRLERLISDAPVVRS
jgi:hypothetical protein